VLTNNQPDSPGKVYALGMRTGVLECAAAVLCVACNNGSSSTDGGNDAGGGTSLTQAESDLADAFCSRYATCIPFALHLIYGDVPTCQTRFGAAIAVDNGLNGFSATGSEVETCAVAINGESCVDLLNGAQPSGCALGGSLAAGTACGNDVQCQSDYCKLDAGSMCGNCAALASLGNACTTGDDCGPGNDCVNQLCVSRAGQGASCANSQPCDSSLYCNASQVCTAPSTTPGGTCDSAVSGSCDLLGSGLYCNTSGICSQVTLAPPGSACGFSGGGLTECADGGACVGSGLTGTCAAPVPDGQPCSPDAGTPQCQQPATCTNGTCQIAMPATCG
jgi:hypothetical protein